MALTEVYLELPFDWVCYSDFLNAFEHRHTHTHNLDMYFVKTNNIYINILNIQMQPRAINFLSHK
jgi:hypothetical protein